MDAIHSFKGVEPLMFSGFCIENRPPGGDEPKSAINSLLNILINYSLPPPPPQ
jgi:hypothetical protein